MRKFMKNTNAGPVGAVSAVALAVALAITPVQSMAKASTAKTSNAAEVKFSDEQWESMVSSNLALRVQSALAGSNSLRGTKITVTADHEGNVTLDGDVASERQQERAVRIARGVPGVKDVDEDIDVDTSLADIKMDVMDDNELAKQVAEAIVAELPGSRIEKDWFFGYDVKGKGKDGDDWSIDVEADDGEIELDGKLPTNADVQTVLRTVRSMGSVRSVDNDLRSDESRYLAHAPKRYDVFAGERSNRAYPGTLVSANGAVEGNLICQFAQAPAKVARAEKQ